MKEIILLGSGQTHGACPYNKETWGVNYVVRYPDFLKNGNKLFFFDDLSTFNPRVMTFADLYNNRHLLEFVTTSKNVEFLKKYNVTATVYPLDQIIHKYKTHYFANSISYMVAYAMFTGVESMTLYGIDHVNYREYLMAKAGLEYWLGRAQQSGMDINICAGSAVLRTITDKLYGYEFKYDKNSVPEEKFIV